MTDKQCRAAFIKEFEPRGYDMRVTGYDLYLNNLTEGAWRGWQAAWSARPAPDESLIEKIYGIKAPDKILARERLAFGIAQLECVSIIRAHAPSRSMQGLCMGCGERPLNLDTHKCQNMQAPSPLASDDTSSGFATRKDASGGACATHNAGAVASDIYTNSPVSIHDDAKCIETMQTVERSAINCRHTEDCDYPDCGIRPRPSDDQLEGIIHKCLVDTYGCASSWQWKAVAATLSKKLAALSAAPSPDKEPVSLDDVTVAHCNKRRAQVGLKSATKDDMKGDLDWNNYRECVQCALDAAEVKYVD